jgi:hypothetical protein
LRNTFNGCGVKLPKFSIVSFFNPDIRCSESPVVFAEYLSASNSFFRERALVNSDKIIFIGEKRIWKKIRLPYTDRFSILKAANSSGFSIKTDTKKNMKPLVSIDRTIPF